MSNIKQTKLSTKTTTTGTMSYTMFQNIFYAASNSYTTVKPTLTIIIIFIFDSMNNMSNLSNLNHANSMNSLGNDLNNLNDMGIRMSNIIISIRKISNLGDGMRNGMANVGGMNGAKEEKFTPNVFGNHYNLCSTDYFDLFKTEGSTPKFTNIGTYGGYNSNNNDINNVSNNCNSNNNNGENNMNNLNNLRHVNNCYNENNGARNLFGGILHTFQHIK